MARSVVQAIKAPSLLSLGGLACRESEVLGLIAAGLKNRKIPSGHSISEKTLGNHVSNVPRKSQVIYRVGAIIRAHVAGMGVEHEG